MRIFRYASNGTARLAIAVGDGAPVDLLDAWTAATDPPDDAVVAALSSTLGLIEAGEEHWRRVREAAEAAPPDATVDERTDGFRWLSPLDRMASLRDFLAFESHVLKGAERRKGIVPDYWYEVPVYYKGNHRQIIGPEDTCPWPSYTDHMDFELELAMIVGRPGVNLTAEDAPEHVFGFTILNDFSARDIQMKEVGAWLGPAKGKDFANAFGPCIITADEVGAAPDLEMICRVNGDEWGRARSSEVHWSFTDMLVHVSDSERVFPGDVYGSGTPGGCCGLDLGRSLDPGDVVELEIERIGTLRNTIGARPG
ncbi:MAG: hypothetical protein GEU71_08545 [Actinobacteria bacterium]|nr:hypothetical protein [Actinomycetota bacterium]